MGHLNIPMFSAILMRAKPAPAIYIETGCNRGDQLAIAAQMGFGLMIGIELDARYAAEAARRIPQAVVKTGDTAELLPSVLVSIHEPVFIILDAHYCKLDPPIAKSRFPLWDELAMLRDRPYADIIVVDDVHTFGKARDDLRYASEPEWETVTGASISSFLGAPGEEIGDGYVVFRTARP